MTNKEQLEKALQNWIESGLLKIVFSNEHHIVANIGNMVYAYFPVAQSSLKDSPYKYGILISKKDLVNVSIGGLIEKKEHFKWVFYVNDKNYAHFFNKAQEQQKKGISYNPDNIDPYLEDLLQGKKAEKGK